MQNCKFSLKIRPSESYVISVLLELGLGKQT